MTRSIRLVLGLLLVGPVVFAQPAATPEPAVPPPAADIPVRQRPTITREEMLSRATEYRQRMGEVGSRLQSSIDQARQSKDVIRINCLVDKLTQVRANIAIVDQATQALREAAARNDDGGSLHEFSRITIVHQKVQVLGAEADACIGEDLSYVGATRIDVDDEGVPQDDFTSAPPAPGGGTSATDTSRPASDRYADMSPFR